MDDHFRLLQADHVLHHAHLIGDRLSGVNDHIHIPHRTQQQGIQLNVALNGRVARFIGHHLNTGILVYYDRVRHGDSTI